MEYRVGRWLVKKSRYLVADDIVQEHTGTRRKPKLRETVLVDCIHIVLLSSE